MKTAIEKSIKERIEDISMLIFEVANGNFDYTIESSDGDDELDAIISGVNMLGQELKLSTVSRDHMQSLYDGVIDMIIVTDLEMNVEKVNDTCAQAIGFEERDLMGKHLTSLIDLQRNSSLIRTIMKQMDEDGKYQNAELYLKTNTGSTVPTSASFSFLKNARGLKEGIMIVAKDITQIKETEKNLILAKEAAEEANESKGRFLSNMSHEIRTPLNGIIGFTDLLKTTELDETQQECVDMISNAGSNLSKLLNDVLDLNKIDLDRLDLEEIPYNFRATFTSNLNPYIHIAGEKGLSLSYSFDSSVPKIVIGDPTRLNQVILNMVSNAIKFTENGKIEVRFFGIGQGKNAKLQCTVADTGIGIPQEKQEAIFDRFTQSDNSVTRKYGGSGLGLAICKQLVELMNGTINIVSPSIDRTHGSTFEFTIPIKVGEEAKKKTIEEEIALQFDDLKVLAVDDNNVNLVLVERILQKTGANVITAMDGKEAVEKAREENPDLILMDIQMPVMDGLSATKILRKEKYIKPILALSANVDKENLGKIKEAGIDDFLQKPFDKPKLTKMISKWTHGD